MTETVRLAREEGCVLPSVRSVSLFLHTHPSSLAIVACSSRVAMGPSPTVTQHPGIYTTDGRGGVEKEMAHCDVIGTFPWRSDVGRNGWAVLCWVHSGAMALESLVL